MQIRPVSTPADDNALWSILEPMIRDGSTYLLSPDLDRKGALAYWLRPEHEVFVIVADGEVVGTYYLRANAQGGGSHVANCGFVVHPAATGRGLARQMGNHALARARERGFKALQYNFVVATNVAAIALWRSLGMETVGRLPRAFLHPTAGYVDGLIMYRTL
ncbi:Ribosomal protein S18 acetylase RimI [Arboricoccus pini]|uniref:Ribosomal protein S18 acetylase RimI n=1 Tax=Arboricoccus pini TaxID=1963835 RepID=A0A212QNA2_9PROT|nr:GNAT family N-acetyltransferase [Arboricoccus pini]SNB60806.1 Ribosomal protein S18 acetylase RimI [Arboricoccus pini]